MKLKKYFLVLTALFIMGLCASNIQAAGPVTYLGKTTWTILIEDSYPDATKIGKSFTVTGGISKVGDEFYLFQGYVTTGTDGPFVLSGSGFMMNNTLFFTLTDSQKHTSETWRDSGIMHISIDKTTQSGSFYEIASSFDMGPARTFGQPEYNAGSLTRTGNLIPMGQDSAALPLLLFEQ